MRLTLLSTLALASGGAFAADATQGMRAGATLMPVKVYTLEDDRRFSRPSTDCVSRMFPTAWISSDCTTSVS